MWVLVWKLLLREQISQSGGCSHGLLTPVARSNWRVVNNKRRDPLLLCVTQLCAFLKSSKFLSHKWWHLSPVLR